MESFLIVVNMHSYLHQRCKRGLGKLMSVKSGNTAWDVTRARVGLSLLKQLADLRFDLRCQVWCSDTSVPSLWPLVLSSTSPLWALESVRERFLTEIVLFHHHKVKFWATDWSSWAVTLLSRCFTAHQSVWVKVTEEMLVFIALKVNTFLFECVCGCVSTLSYKLPFISSPMTF